MTFYKTIMNDILHSFAIGYDCLSASADLLDRINVFPVADGDTGTNLRISLAPFRSPGQDSGTMRLLLARCATGNSGNIAAAFFREFCRAQSMADLPEAAALGKKKAWQAIARPCAGTMLTVFDSLVSTLASHETLSTVYSPLSLELQKAVGETTRRLPILSEAGVVDSGALAMYVFFDGFFRNLTQPRNSAVSIFDLFAGKLAISHTFQPETSSSYCVDAVIQLPEGQAAAPGEPDERAKMIDDLAGLGESVVVVENDSSLKIHIHTPDPDRLRGQLDLFGNVVRWSDEAMNRTVRPLSAAAAKSPLHIVTDAAGSITREMARLSGLTLLDSYIIAGDESRPESLCNSEDIYRMMREGGKVTTAQASTFERYQHYQNISRQFGPSLYLCVGAAFTGNYDTALSWKMEHDIDDRFTVLDSGAASGKLALIALLTGRYAENADGGADIIAFAEKVIEECEEYVFIHELKYLVAGGRVSKAGGFFGDLLHMKPVITPTRNGVQKVGVVHSTRQQLAFALEKLKKQYDPSATPTVMLQYSDNQDWVAEVARQQVRSLLPEAEILLTPLSLTSGIHMGPGTWSMAFASSRSSQ